MARVLQGYADRIHPLGVLDQPPEPAEPDEEDLDCDGALQRYRQALAAKRRAVRAQRERAAQRAVTVPCDRLWSPASEPSRPE